MPCIDSTPSAVVHVLTMGDEPNITAFVVAVVVFPIDFQFPGAVRECAVVRHGVSRSIESKLDTPTPVASPTWMFRISTSLLLIVCSDKQPVPLTSSLTVFGHSLPHDFGCLVLLQTTTRLTDTPSELVYTNNRMVAALTTTNNRVTVAFLTVAVLVRYPKSGRRLYEPPTAGET